MSSPPSSRLARVSIAAATVACMILAVVAVLRVVGPATLGIGSSAETLQPIGFDDYALQFYYGQLGARNLVEGGVTFGYDPHFLAGYPKSPIYYPSSKPYEYSLAFFDGSDPGTVFNRTVFAMLALIPFLVYGTAANFRLSPGTRLAAVAMSAVPHLMVPMAGFYGVMEAAGMVPYIFASFLSVFVVSLVDRFLADGEKPVAVALLVAAPLLYRSHLTAVFISAVPIAAIYLKRFRAAPWSRHLWLWGVLATIVAANWSWLEGYLLYSHWGDLGEFYTPGGSEHFVPKGGWLAPLQVYVASPKLVSLIPPVMGMVGLALWWRERRTALLVAFVPQLIFLFVVSFYGLHFGLNAIAPARITLPLGIYAFFPAGHALCIFATRVQAIVAKRLPKLPGYAVAAGLWALVGLVALLGALPAKVWRPYTLPSLELREGFSENAMALVDWLDRHTDGSGRLLHEETDRDSHQYFGAHMPSWVPYYTSIQFAGGPAPHPLVKQNYLRFIAGTWQGKPLRRIPPATLRSQLELYNVRWLLAWTPTSKRRFDRMRIAERVGDFRKFTLYRIDLPPSWFVQGSGEATLDGSRIVLRKVSPEDGFVVIKYHWLESLRTDPPLEIEQRFALDDPAPFIAVKDPPRELVIYNDYDYGLLDAR